MQPPAAGTYLGLVHRLSLYQSQSRLSKDLHHGRSTLFVGHQDAHGIQDSRSPTRKAGTRKEHTTATCHLLEIGSQRCSEVSEDSRIGHLS